MKILIIYPDLNFRGGERLFTDFANNLQQRDHDVIFVTARVGNNVRKINQLIKFIIPPLLINSILQNNFLFIIFSPLFIFFMLLANIKNADLIYTSESVITSWPSIIMGLIFNKKVTVSIFELNGTSKTHGIKKIIYNLLYRLNLFFFKRASFITSINPSIVYLLKKKYRYKNVKFIPAGLDFNLFAKTRNSRIHKEYQFKSKQIIIMPGIIHPAKKQAFALKILSEVKKKIPNIHLIFIGGGKQIDLVNLKKLVRAKNLQNYTTITGYLKEKELPDYYKLAKMTLMCGPIAGLTIIESLYMGTMPIYPKSGTPPLGPSEPFKLGIIINRYDSKIFARKIVKYLKNPKKFAEKLQKDKAIVEKNFDINYVIEKTLHFTD